MKITFDVSRQKPYDPMTLDNDQYESGIRVLLDSLLNLYSFFYISIIGLGPTRYVIKK